jgi:hypothetical protein
MFRRSAREDVVDEGAVADERASVVSSPTWSPAQIVAVVLGAASVILGIAALAKTGLPLDHMDRPEKVVWSFRHTPLMGAIEIVFGALLLIAGVVPGALRSLMGLLGAISAAFGVVILVDVAPARLNKWLGVTDRNGWLFLIGGAVILLAAFLSPTIWGGTRERRVRHRRHITA